MGIFFLFKLYIKTMKSYILAALLGSCSAIRVEKYDTCANGSCQTPQWPGEVLPGSEPVLRIPSSPVDDGYEPTLNSVFDNRWNVQLNSELEANARSNARAQIKVSFREALSPNRPTSDDFLMLEEVCETVECAREQAAQMQAQLDQGVADADAKREEQARAFET